MRFAPLKSVSTDLISVAPSFKTPFVGNDLIEKVNEVSVASISLALRVITGFVVTSSLVETF